MRPRSRSSRFRLRSSPSKSPAKPENSNRRSRRLKPRKLNWTRQRKNSNGCIRRDTSCTCSGRTPLKTVAAVTSSSTKRASSTVMRRAGWSARRMSTSSTWDGYSVRRKPTRRLKVKSRLKSASSSRLGRACRVVTKKSRSLKAKSPFWLTNCQPSPLSCKTSVVPSQTSTRSSKKRWSVLRLQRRSTRQRSTDCLQSNLPRKNLNRLTRALKANTKNRRA